MNSATAGVALAVFAASAVESVEAVTIVIAAGVTRGWRSAFEGAAAALVVLAAIVAVLGPLVVKAPLSGLRIVIGAILLVYGMQWLRKAILRAAGVIPKHDEDAIFEREVARLETRDSNRDATSGPERGAETTTGPRAPGPLGTGSVSPWRSKACSSKDSRSS